MSHSSWYVTWYVCSQLTFNHHIANDTWPDAHYGIAEFEKYPEASNWDRMRVIVWRYARRRMRIRVKGSFNESFLRLTLWRHVTCDGLTSRFLTLWRHVTCDGLTSRFLTLWRHVTCDGLTSRFLTLWRHITCDGLTSRFLTLWLCVFTSRPPAIRHIHVNNRSPTNSQNK